MFSRKNIIGAGIYPQPHDVPLDAIITEEGVQVMHVSEHTAQKQEGA